VSNLIIVESKTDQYFIEAFSDNLNLQYVNIFETICNIDEFNCLDGYTNLQTTLHDIRTDEYKKIGIILDADNIGIERRIEFINESLKKICTDINIEKMNYLYTSEELDLKIACYIMNIDGKGELETVMRKVKSKDSTYADCLQSWRDCLESKDIFIKDKEFDKIWVSNYLKYDTCIRKDKKQKFKKCANELINNVENTDEIENNLQSNDFTIKKDIWDFEHSSLNELRNFLQLFD